MNPKLIFYFVASGILTSCSVRKNNPAERIERIIVPSSFTPNGDGDNDTWQIQNLQDYDNVRIRVFNRFGELAYQSNGPYRPWNGTYKNSPVPPGQYFYTIDIGRRSRNPNGWLVIER